MNCFPQSANDTDAIVFDPAKPAASIALLCDKMAQEKGDQSRKILGALSQPLAKNDGKATHSADLTATLEIAGMKLPVRATTGLWLCDCKGDEKARALMLDGRFTLKAADLGLKTGETIAVRFGLTAYPAQTILNSKP